MRTELSKLDGSRYDVVIVGAGINGSCAAARLAEGGFRVLLVDKGDIGGGSSSRSSRLLHCGLNYLASAREAPKLTDKLRHLRSARQMLGFRAAAGHAFPERVRRRRFHIPVFADAPISRWQFDLAFASLSALSGFREKLGYESHAPGQADAPPILAYFGKNLVSAASYVDLVYDWPERICVDFALEASAYGADVRNYTTLTEGRATERGWELELADGFEPDKKAAVSARLLLNLAGVWSDAVNADVAIKGGRPTVTPNKGCHIAVRLPDAFADRGIICRNAIGHLFICVPWRGLHIIGPTETAYAGKLDGVTPDDADVALLLAQANETMPGLGLGVDDVIFRWAGLRPAAYEAGNPRGAWTRMFHDLSPRPEAPALGLSWGRIVDHADTADRIVRLVRGKLGSPERGGRPAERRSAVVAAQPDDLAAIIGREQAMTVADVLFRRTGQGWDPDLGLSSVDPVAHALAEKTGRKSAAALIGDYHALLRETFGYRGPLPAAATT